MKHKFASITLVLFQGAQNGLHSIYGSAFGLDNAFKMDIFEQLKDSLVTNGKVAVIQFDKRSCKSPAIINDSSNLTASQPFCSDLCPNWCPNLQNSCNLVTECYNDTNMTVGDLVNDAKIAFTDSTTQIKKYLNSDIIDLNRIWPVPIGYSAQGAFIGTLVASQNAEHNPWPTAVTLMGSGIPIDELLMNQMQNQTETIKVQMQSIKNGTINETQLVFVENGFLEESEEKYAKYWKDWMRLTDELNYEQIDNFMAINSAKDEVITPQSFNPLKDRFHGNQSVFFRVYQDLNHWMVSTDNWESGQWKIDTKVSEDIVNYFNEINGYLDRINEYILWNNSNRTDNEERAALVENVNVYKVLLYVAIVVIVLMMALCLYFIVADKVCPYEFEDMDAMQAENERNEQRERERRRRRRRRRHRRRRSSSHRHVNDPSAAMGMIELNEPMIQSVLNPLMVDDANGSVQNNHQNDERLPAYEELNGTWQ